LGYGIVENRRPVIITLPLATAVLNFAFSPMTKAFCSFSKRTMASAVVVLAVVLAWSSALPAQETAPPANGPVSASTGTAQAPAVANPTTPTPTNNALELGPGDLVEVSVYNVPELTTKARIGANGDLYLPLIDYVHVGGLSVDEAQSVIEKRLSSGGFVKDPHVTVFVDEYASQGATLLGEVAKPGVYPVLGQQRLFDLLSVAGGLSDKAGNSVTITHRAQPDKPLTVPMARNVTEVPDSNIRIFPGDTVVVRRADIVYVVGDVQHPTGILMDKGSITVLQAIAMAGGVTKTSKLNGSRLIHKGSSGITETKIEMKKLLEAKVPDVPMSPDDILFIPSSAFREALHTDASIATQVASLGVISSRF
jgi:polysaccharide biosynthesis/export protein